MKEREVVSSHKTNVPDVYSLKLIFSTGSNKGSDETYEGSIEIPNLSEENEPHELEVSRSAVS